MKREFVRRCAVFAVLAATALVAGCVTTGSQLRANQGQLLDRAKPAADFREIKARSLPLDEALLSQIGIESTDKPLSAAIEYQGEKTFVELFSLPPWSAPYSINVASMMFGGAADPALFYPRYLLLNEDFSVSRHSKASDFVYRSGFSEGMITASAYVNTENRNERYLAIVSEPKSQITEKQSLLQSEGGVPLVAPVGGGALVWVIRTGGNEAPKTMRAAKGGTIRIKLDSYKPKRIGE
jgi:Maltose operon periplasmic protein precursor (MalM)